MNTFIPSDLDTLHPRLDPEQVKCVVEAGEAVVLPAGTVLFDEGTPATQFFLLLEGRLLATKRIGGDDAVLAEIDRPGQFTGSLDLLTGSATIATVRAVIESLVVRVTGDRIRGLLTSCPGIRDVLIGAMVNRRIGTDVILQQREKMAALGKLSAGLAHELNNPAAAAGRAAARLREALATAQRLSVALADRLGNDRAAALARDAQALATACADAASEGAIVDPLDLSDREQAIADWLGDRGVAGAFELAPVLASAGVDSARLAAAVEGIGPADLPDALEWLGATLSAVGLLREIESATARVSKLVAAVKSYSYMDQAPRQDVDVHAGLEDTLTMLAHKARQKGVRIDRAYDRALPRVTAFGAELNQVWTNLLDNAIDAVPDAGGRIVVTTTCEGTDVLVEIADNGPGIPAAVAPRIFEPFFTTKGVGKGTGLGLDIAYRIVVTRHHGDIRVQSQPGDTRFQVRLPVTKA